MLNPFFLKTSPRPLLLTLVTIVVIQTATNRAAENKAEINDVTDFGAVGDGKHDDGPAIQKAIDSGVGRVRFPKGIFRLTRPITIDLDKVGYVSLIGDGVARVVMAGSGPAFKFVGTHEKSADPQGFSENVWERQRMPLIDGLAIVGDHPEAEGISAIGTMQLTITRVHGRKLLHVVHLSGNNRNVSISNCHFYENRGCGVLYDEVNLHQSNITACHISYNAGGGIVSRGGNVRNIHITGCDIESNMSPESPATANVLIDSAGSIYGTGEVAITGCTIQHNNPSPESANIRILGRSAPSKVSQAVREGNVTITGNVLSDVKVNIHLKDCRGVAISGNTFWQGYQHNLLIEDCTAVVMGANNLDRNPRYDYGNTSNANNGVVFRGCSDCIISGALVSNVWREPAGVILENCRRCNVTDCTIVDCDQVGLLIKDSVNCRISDCIIRDDRKGMKTDSVVIRGGSGIVVTDSVLSAPPKITDSDATQRDNTVVPGGT
jgi:parallel beta-helix repeat protein